MPKYLWLLIAALLTPLLLVACGGSGEANDGDADDAALPAAVADSSTNRVTLDELTFDVRETPG